MSLDAGDRVMINTAKRASSDDWVFAAKSTREAGYVPRHFLVAADDERAQAAPAAPTPEFYWEARRDAEGADAPDGGALARARARRAFAMEEPPEMDLAEGDTLLVLVEEHADEAQGWIFAAKAAEAGYVPRTYLELAADDAPAKAPTPEVTDSSAARRSWSPSRSRAPSRRRILLCPPCLLSRARRRRRPKVRSPRARSRTTSGPSSSASTRSARGPWPRRRSSRRSGTTEASRGPSASRVPSAGARTTRRSSATTSRARSRRWTPTACPGMNLGARRSARRTARATASGNSPTRTRSSSGASRARAATASAASSGAPWRAATTTTRTRRGRRGRTRRGPATRCTTSSRTSSRSAGLRRAV